MPISLELQEDVLDRFLRYVQIDTQSAEESTTYPSTAKQLDLLRMLAGELQELGLGDGTMAPEGYVTATLPGTLPSGDPRFGKTPVIGLLAHVDTAPGVSDAHVKPQLVCDYRGGDIVLPADPAQVIRVSDYPELERCLGHDIVTTDGTTLLGADDKAGVAEIMAALAYLLRYPEIPHGRINVAFTPDEEVGRGTEHFDLATFGADYAYTIDGGGIGEIEDETFCADTVRITIRGHNVHAGYAKGKMVNSLKLAADLVMRLPKDRLSPETTEGREGYVHPESIQGAVEETHLKFIVRDFSLEGLHQHEALLRRLLDSVIAGEPRAHAEFVVEEYYRNMKQVLDQHPRVVAYAEEAIRKAGLPPVRRPIRGGTDGAKLSFAGLPTANIFTGGHGFHSKLEWVSVQDMCKAAETIVHLVQIWADRG